jgi:hypothetical protein
MPRQVHVQIFGLEIRATTETKMLQHEWQEDARLEARHMLEQDAAGRLAALLGVPRGESGWLLLPPKAKHCRAFPLHRWFERGVAWGRVAPSCVRFLGQSSSTGVDVL